jgi:hypothetical protein
MRGLAFVVSVVMLAACERSSAKPVTPEATYRQFAEALRGHDPKLAWEHLSPSTKAAAEARVKAVAAASGGLVRDEPMLVVFQSGVLPEPNIGEISTVTKEDNTVVLEVGVPTHRQQVTLVKDPVSGAWSVDLSAAFLAEASK